MKKVFYITFLVLAFCFQVKNATAQISGRVFRDWNANGIQEQNDKAEMGVADVIVKGYDRQNQLIATAQTASDGSYKLSIGSGKNVRIEFSALPDGYVSSQARGAVTQFINSSNNVLNLGIYDPNNYSKVKRSVVLPIYINGNHSVESSKNESALVLFDTENPTKKTTLAKASEIGSVWGVAYHKGKNAVFASAIAKRHVGYGTLGTGGIYVTDLKTNTTKPFINLSDFGIQTGKDNHKDLNGELNSQSLDGEIFDQIGKVSLGGLDVSEDGRTLFVMNLYDKTLYGIKISDENKKPSSSDIMAYKIPNPNFQGGDYRPYAVKYYHGKVFVGVVSDAQISQKKEDLQAIIYSLDVDNKEFNKFYSMSLDYSKGEVIKGTGITGWYPWTDNFEKTIVPDVPNTVAYPQAILSDIEFDEEGSMILGFMDRFGNQSGTGQPNPVGTNVYTGVAAGDILRVAYTERTSVNKKTGEVISEKGLSNLESNATAGNSKNMNGVGNNQGPSGGEFYSYDDFEPFENRIYHEENSVGGLAIVVGKNQIINSVHEPTDEYNTGGVKWFSNKTGKSEKGFIVYADLQPGTFSKSNGVGDVEIVSDLPSIEIGNRIWIDANENGFQDSDEFPSGGITIELYESEKLIATTTSNEQGEYWFNDNNVSGGLKTSTNYEIRIPVEQNNVKVKTSKTKEGTNAEIDNDAIGGVTYSKIALKTGGYGENSYSYDIGVLCSSRPNVKVNALENATEKEVKLLLSGFESTYRFNCNVGKQYSSNLGYEDASIISANGIIYSDFLNAQSPKDYTFRVYNSKGCYSDVSVDLKALLGEMIDELFVVYPNPSSDKIKIDYKGKQVDVSEISITLYDMLGKSHQTSIVKGINGSYTTTLDVSKLSEGSYVIGIQEGNKISGKGITKK